MIYRFQSCELDTERAELQVRGNLQPVEPQVFHLIVHLIEHRDRLVSKDELINEVWGGRFISDATLSSRISSARSAVGDSGVAQEIIRTVPRRGYRFVAELKAPGEPHQRDSHRQPRPFSRTVRYCTAKDGVGLAYAVSGEGPPLVKTMSWLNHLDFDWESPVFGPLFRELSSRHQLLRYDSRGAGLSDREVKDFSFDALASDLEAVIAASGIEPFAMLGISQGAALAIDYAARHPERVSHLVLWGGYARGRKRRGRTEDAEQAEAFKTLMRHGWGKPSSTFLRMFASLYLPEANEKQIQWWTDLQRVATSPENAVRLRDAIDDIDVSDRLAQVKAPTLILHSEREEVAPFSEARRMAARIPNATLVPLDSANHLVLTQETAWQRAVDEIVGFLSP